MQYDYNDIVRQFFEELKPLFVNYLRKNFVIDYDMAMGIYTDVWIDVRRNIRQRRVEPGTKWKAYILKMGCNQASNMATRRPHFDHLDDESFNREEFDRRYTDDREADISIYQDPDVQAVLATELSYIPDPCNKILKLYYYENLSMGEIAAAMNYRSANSAKTTKNRCIDKLRSRMTAALRLIGILD